jgi:hypothetical protein
MFFSRENDTLYKRDQCCCSPKKKRKGKKKDEKERDIYSSQLRQAGL